MWAARRWAGKSLLILLPALLLSCAANKSSETEMDDKKAFWCVGACMLIERHEEGIDDETEVKRKKALERLKDAE
jgi:hypothetical protein